MEFEGYRVVAPKFKERRMARGKEMNGRLYGKGWMKFKRKLV